MSRVLYRSRNGTEAVLSIPRGFTPPDDIIMFRNTPRPSRPMKFSYAGDGKCSAVVRHGPGSQSTTRCEEIGTHEVHTVSALGSSMEYVEWTDDQMKEGSDGEKYFHVMYWG